MRGRRRGRIRSITEAGWELLEEGRDAEGKYRLEVRGPAGERVILRATSRPRCLRQAEQVLKRGRKLLVDGQAP